MIMIMIVIVIVICRMCIIRFGILGEELSSESSFGCFLTSVDMLFDGDDFIL